jgi:hypothetical protein
MRMRVAHYCKEEFRLRIYSDEDGDLWLAHVWEKFTHKHLIRLGDLLICTFDGTDLLTIKVFNIDHCRVVYGDPSALEEERGLHGTEA